MFEVSFKQATYFNLSSLQLTKPIEFVTKQAVPMDTNLHNFETTCMCNLKPVNNAQRKIKNFRRNFVNSQPIHTSLSFTTKFNFVDSKHIVPQKVDESFVDKATKCTLWIGFGSDSRHTKRVFSASVQVWRQIETAFLHISNGLFHVNYGRTAKEFFPLQIRS